MLEEGQGHWDRWYVCPSVGGHKPFGPHPYRHMLPGLMGPGDQLPLGLCFLSHQQWCGLTRVPDAVAVSPCPRLQAVPPTPIPSIH